MPDPRKMQVSLTGFMDKHGAAAFMSDLWKLLLSAQDTVGGVPAEVSCHRYDVCVHAADSTSLSLRKRPSWKRLSGRADQTQTM
jgi:serine/arginine repetitive matrix protein 1